MRPELATALGVLLLAVIGLVLLGRRGRKRDVANTARRLEQRAAVAEEHEKHRKELAVLHPDWPQIGLCAEQSGRLGADVLGEPCIQCGHVTCGFPMLNACDVCAYHRYVTAPLIDEIRLAFDGLSKR